LNVIARGSTLSAREKQERFFVRGTKGSWRKVGLDSQEDQLRTNPPLELTDEKFGKGELKPIFAGQCGHQNLCIEASGQEGELTSATESGSFVVSTTTTDKGD
jgi:hypothetical protein